MKQQEQIESELNQDELQEVTGGSNNNNNAAILGGAGIVATSIAVVGGLGVRQMGKMAKNTESTANSANSAQHSIQGINAKIDDIGSHFIQKF